MSIKILPINIVNKISAGEIVNNPSSIIKELLENSLDAKCDNIEISIRRGGKSFISVADNGNGIDSEDLALILNKHSTSKLYNNNIRKLKFLGFRGDALSSISSISKLEIISCKNSKAWYLCNDKKFNIKPTFYNKGTYIKVENLFYNDPIKLRFLKKDYIERNNCLNIINKIALSQYKTSFKFISDGKIINDIRIYKQNMLKNRIEDILGNSFIKNSLYFSFKTSCIKIYGYTSIPTFYSNSKIHQYYFVNNRIVKDKYLFNAIQYAYANLIPKNKFARIIIYIFVKSNLLDINIHPTKMKIRFLNWLKVRKIIINIIKNTLVNSKIKGSSEIEYNILSLLKNYNNITKLSNNIVKKNIKYSNIFFKKNNLGIVKCQIDKTYILSEKKECLIFIDQHAAHERIMLEKIKEQLKSSKINFKELIYPEIIHMGVSLTSLMLNKKKELEEIGLFIEYYNTYKICVKKIPILFKNIDIVELLNIVSKNLHYFSNLDYLKQKKEKILGNIACHNSIKANCKLKLIEMNLLLKEMEKYPLTSQCNHGRPTFIKLYLKDIKKIFGRS